MIVRTYFDRNNTLINNQLVNTGQNPITELYYGGPANQSISRFIFQFDVSRLIDFRTKGMFPDLTKLKHTLRMTNTGAFDLTLQGQSTIFNGKERSSSFDLILFPLTQQWDEGVGYDYNQIKFVSEDCSSVSTSPSNWFESGTNVSWVNGGGSFSGQPTVLVTQHFEHGNENLEMDITSIVNAYLTGGTNYGLGIAYTYDLENTIREEAQYVGFFTRHTQTFYEPHVETIYDDRILDDRYNFYMNKDNRLYLYSNAGGKPIDLDFLPSVKVYNDEGELIQSSTATKASQGVYYIDINIQSSNQNDCTMYTDIWENISINGNVIPNIEMDFSVKSEGYYNIGAEIGSSTDYMFSASGIKYGEKIVRGDIRKVMIDAKIPYTANQKVGLEDAEYRLYVKEGRNQFTVIDYQKMNMALNQNYFLLDTLSLLPSVYYLDIKYSLEYEVKSLPEVLKFEIVSLSELRKSQ